MTTAVVICPGRGTYNKAELGTLARWFPDQALMGLFDGKRTDRGQETLTALDGAERFSPDKHTRGDNASALIYAASYGDFLALDSSIDIVAVTGNSMGWYSTLACGGALSAGDAFDVVNTMGLLMQEALIGGQLIYPHVEDDWRPAPERKAELLSIAAEIGERPHHDLALSIDLGGMLVLAGNEAGLVAFEAAVPPLERFPMRLKNHAAFHTWLMAPISERGRRALPPGLFGQPRIPMVDGRGAIWWPGATNTEALWNYTLGTQVTQSYDFTHAVEVAAREFAPDQFIILGPGTTLGGAVIQSLIGADWRGLCNKAAFQNLQSQDPLVVSVGRVDQRTLVARRSTL